MRSTAANVEIVGALATRGRRVEMFEKTLEFIYPIRIIQIKR
jgi:hypothetical protein